MGKACKKDWDMDIAYICNVFAFIAVWINPLRIEAKIGMFAHQNLCQWIYFMWDTMIPRALQDFIKTDQIRRKLEWDIKENTALNLIQDFLSDGHLDLEVQRLIRLNHTFYKFIFSMASNISQPQRNTNTRKFCESFQRMAINNLRRMVTSTTAAR